MDIPQLRAVFRYYDHFLGQRGIEPETNHHQIGDTPLRHARWMCQTALREFLPQKRVQKSVRWLGFVQGILFMSGSFQISELCRHVLTNGSEGDEILTKENEDGQA